MYRSILFAALALCLTLPAAAVAHGPLKREHAALFAGACPAPARLHTREFFTLCFRPDRKTPTWVGYELDSALLRGSQDRTKDFRPDTDLPKPDRAELADYFGSGFDRGHMAEAESFKRNRTTMSATFLLSNMAPQTVSLNRGRWRRVEEDVRAWIAAGDGALVFTGSLYLDAEMRPVAPTLVIGDDVAVPTHSFKAVYREAGDEAAALAFVLPNRRKRLPGPSARWLVDIDALEEMLGADLFAFLPDHTETHLERDFVTPPIFR